jgi:hypothetical protein
MAKRVEFKVPHLAAVKSLYYTPETPVGTRKNITNKKKADVQLVQFFLSQFYTGNPDLYRKLPPTKSGKFLIDGDCGPQTKQGIWVFQTWAQKNRYPIYPDGAIDPATQYASPTGRYSYSIIILNDWWVENGTGREYLLTLENHPDLRGATELRADLRTAK